MCQQVNGWRFLWVVLENEIKVPQRRSLGNVAELPKTVNYLAKRGDEAGTASET
jgi:hypothetical protein